MSSFSTIAMATSKFRALQTFGKQLRQISIRNEAAFSTTVKLLKDPVEIDIPTHTGQVIAQANFIGELILAPLLSSFFHKV